MSCQGVGGVSVRERVSTPVGTTQRLRTQFFWLRTQAVVYQNENQGSDTAQNV